MDARDLFYQRQTVRKFLDKPVSKELLTSVLEAATRAPSWANSQPWELYVAGGETLDILRNLYLNSFEKNESGQHEMPVPQKWPQDLDARMKKGFTESFKSMGIRRDDETARRENWENNYRFFGAPIAVFLCLDASLTDWSLLDIGIVANSLMLAAKAYGLDSVPAASSVSYPQHLRKVLNIPDRLKIVVGIMLGYGDTGHPYNQYRSSRAPLEEVVHFRF